MKTNEFIKAVEELGFTTLVKEYSIRVDNYDGSILIYVRKDLPLVLETIWSMGVPEELFDLAVEYAKTPIDEREEPKKYHLRHKYLTGYGGYNFLKIDKYYNDYLLSTNNNSTNYQTEFTQEEIENLPFEVNTSEWELIEVQE